MFKRRQAAPPPPTVRALSDQLGDLERIDAFGGHISYGAPTRCPECGAFGMVDSLTPALQENRCLSCGRTWSFSPKAVGLFESAKASRGGVTSNMVVGHGVLLDGVAIDASRTTMERFVGLGSAMRNTREVVVRRSQDPAVGDRPS